MTEPAGRAREAASRLVELLDVEVRMAEEGGGIRIFLELPPHRGETNHLEVLSVLQAADRFGHRRRSGQEQLRAVCRSLPER
ncbi:hypothetical protein [Kitasatospora cineracea]|uniref:hypothetical protein n=1 Tax=Kitasatospora cineracea TaxID=88074 RepID=UPI0033FF447E